MTDRDLLFFRIVAQIGLWSASAALAGYIVTMLVSLIY